MATFRPGPIRDLLKATHVETAVETGTRDGQTTRKLARMFKTVHTVEIDRGLYEANLDGRFSSNVHPWCSDSAKVVRMLAEEINEPVLWYLDAHWYPGQDGNRDNPFPLFRELDSIGKRDHPDVVMVDDLKAFGRKEWGANPPPGVVENWSHLTPESVVARLTPRVASWRLAEDKVIVYLKGR